MILVDTSAWIDYLAGNDSPAATALDELIEQAVPFGLTELVFQELLQGLATEDEFNKLYEYLETQRFYRTKNGLESYSNAAKLYIRCRRSGITVRSTIDCLIAQVAIENDLVLLHNDRDFALMAKAIPELKLFESS